MKISLPVFDDARVLVVGDLILDRYGYGATERISPGHPSRCCTCVMSSKGPVGRVVPFSEDTPARLIGAGFDFPVRGVTWNGGWSEVAHIT